MIGRDEARALAEAFLRSQIRQWDELGVRLKEIQGRGIPDCYVFGYSPTLPDTRGRVPRFGGNWPVVVDANSGECRKMAGMNEYRSFRARNRRP